jgi:hypothetical protein
MPDIITPATTTAWLRLLGLLGIGLFQVFRARTLQRNATFFDGLGLSTIAFDYVLGGAYLIAWLWVLVPAFHTQYMDVIVLTAAMIAAGWAWYEVRRASQWRIERAVSSGHSPHSGHLDPDFTPETEYAGEDRRSAINPYGRRRKDRERGA